MKKKKTIFLVLNNINLYICDNKEKYNRPHCKKERKPKSYMSRLKLISILL